MADWQPIETAPRDGTRVLTYDSVRGFRDLMKWNMKTGDWRDDAGEFFLQPTHWQPLPAPPSEGR